MLNVAENPGHKYEKHPNLFFLLFPGVLNKMDRKANPCTDFYRYACGGWEKRNYIDDSEVFVLSYMEIGNENKRQLKEILENKEVKLNYSAVSIAAS